MVKHYFAFKVKFKKLQNHVAVNCVLNNYNLYLNKLLANTRFNSTISIFLKFLHQYDLFFIEIY